MKPWIEAFRCLSVWDWVQMGLMAIIYWAVIQLGLEIGKLLK